MESKIVTMKSLIKEKVENKNVINVPVYAGSKEHNLSVAEPNILSEKAVRIVNLDYEKSEGHYKVWNRIHELRNKLNLPKNGDLSTMNAAQMPAAADIAALIGQFFIDVTRRAEELPDYTSRIAEEIVNLNFPQSVTLQEFYEYLGEFQQIDGAGDSVPLVKQFTGTTDSVTLDIYGLGWKTVLANILFNPIHNLQKVSRAVSKAYIDYRNANTIGVIVGATYHASQTQAASAISGATYDVNVYMTVRNGIELLRSLKDNQTDRPISTATGIKLLCNSVDSWDLERVIYGQLVTAGTDGTITAQNVQALPIDEIIVYDQGMTNGRDLGGKTLSFPGVTAGTFYLYIPSTYFKVLTKRGLTLETGPGNVLALTQEERAWYTAGGKYYKDFLGSSYSGASSTGYGAIVKCTMPTP